MWEATLLENIWELAYQTLTVSLTAAVLLLVKWLLRDKLSPRWQYGVWAVLALRALIPASTARGVLPPLALWLETAKSAAELHLDSAYSAAFEAIHVRHALPWVSGAPRSLTDWLFVIYALGVLLTLGWYAFRYAQLRVLLLRGRGVSAETRAAIDAAAAGYGLRSCRAVAVPGLKSAFVCGVFRPVLAVPDGEAPDRRVILHELLHLKYGDAAQNVFWCCLRALHWCNPFMQYVFNRVGNDMESLCDQRVLERLKGEERREYGGILLSMAGTAYARAPGTSSISNGARNISRRIEAIARFKRYPRGMALAGVCTALVLGVSLLTGAAADYSGYSEPKNTNEVLTSLAASRLERCTTVPGAIDTYLKGVIYSDYYNLAMASPLSEQERIYRECSEVLGGDWAYSAVDFSMQPFIYALREGSDGVFHAYAALSGASLYAPYFDGEQYADGMTFVMPLEIEYMDGGYVVHESGERRWLDLSDTFGPAALPAYGASAETPAGTLTVSLGSEGMIHMEPYTYRDGSVVSAEPGYTLSGVPNPDAAWEDMFDTGFSLRLENVPADAGDVSLSYRWLTAGEDAEDFFSSAVAAAENDISHDGRSTWGSMHRTGAELDEQGGFAVEYGFTDWNYYLAPDDAPYYSDALAVTVFVGGERAGDYVLEMEAVQ